MLRYPANSRNAGFAWRCLAVSLIVRCALPAVICNSATALAQVSAALTLAEPAQPAPSKEPDPSLNEWRADVEARLKEAEAKSTEHRQAATEPPAALKRQLEILARIDLVLAQLADEQGKTQQIEVDRQKYQAALDQLVQHGVDGETASFQQLDEIREELQSEQRKLKRSVDKEKAAVNSLEKAQEDLKEKETARLLANENFEDNRDDELRQVLGERRAASRERSELSKAVASLRRQEVINARAAREIQELHLQILQEKEKRLQSVVVFGPQELSELFEELDRQEDDLKNRVAKFESAAQLQTRVVEDQWINARRQFDATTGENPELREKIAAFELAHQVLKKIPPLLRLQLDLLNRNRQIWRYRQRVFSGRPDRATLRGWSEESTDALSQIKREERKAVFEIDELGEQLDAAEERLKKFKEQSLNTDVIEKQSASLRSLLQYQEECLSSIRASLWLHERLLSELEGDSLTATAKDQLQNLWDGVAAVWNYELATFGDGENERAVTVRKVVTALFILLAGIIFSGALSRVLRRQVLRRLDIDPSASATIQSLFYYMLLLLFGLFALNVAKVPLTAFTVLGGAVALGIGFGSQNIINNFISGLILLAERPVKVGDLIQIDHLTGGTALYGNVEHIGARSTRVRTGSNLEIIVPNSSFLQNNVINFTLSSDRVRTRVEVGVVYGSPTVTVTQLLRRAVIETGRVAKDPPPIILFKNFGDSALVFEVHFWIQMRTMMDQMQIESAVRFRVDQLFREAGITIAFPQRDVHLDTTAPLTIQMMPDRPAAKETKI